MENTAELIDQALDGRVRPLARLITRLENNGGEARQILPLVYRRGGQAHIVGITGPPGTGKSSLVSELAKIIRQDNRTVAIIAVDPTSPFTGGALLGDRVRMRDLAGDRGVFIRSMASRGRLGGLSQATGAVVQLLDAAGYDVILIETVGAGQAEVDIASTAHTTLVIEAPGMGDDVQSIKAGILEIADILVVNKADRPGAEHTARALRAMLELGRPAGLRHHGHFELPADDGLPESAEESAGWAIPVIKTCALDGSGLEELATQIDAHGRLLRHSDLYYERERRRVRMELESLLRDQLIARFRAQSSLEFEEEIIAAVARREIDPYTAVSTLVSGSTEDNEPQKHKSTKIARFRTENK